MAGGQGVSHDARYRHCDPVPHRLQAHEAHGEPSQKKQDRARPILSRAHAVISAAGAEVLNSFFGRDHREFNMTSEVLPGVERPFTNVSAAAEEATFSRIFAGQHFGFDLRATDSSTYSPRTETCSSGSSAEACSTRRGR
jgi:hypothetical protein